MFDHLIAKLIPRIFSG